MTPIKAQTRRRDFEEGVRYTNDPYELARIMLDLHDAEMLATQDPFGKESDT